MLLLVLVLVAFMVGQGLRRARDPDTVKQARYQRAAAYRAYRLKTRRPFPWRAFVIVVGVTWVLCLIAGIH